MPYYEFCLIARDGGRLSGERHLAADLDTVWVRVFHMAELESAQGRQIRVLDDQGKVVIGIGANAAALFRLNDSVGSGAAPTAHGAKAATRPDWRRPRPSRSTIG